MPSQRVYVETSIVSYLTALPSRDLVLAAHQQVTREWWSHRERFELLVSDAVLVEAARGDGAAAAVGSPPLRASPFFQPRNAPKPSRGTSFRRLPCRVTQRSTPHT